jgi:hypothetical protein
MIIIQEEEYVHHHCDIRSDAEDNVLLSVSMKISLGYMQLVLFPVTLNTYGFLLGYICL